MTTQAAPGLDAPVSAKRLRDIATAINPFAGTGPSRHCAERSADLRALADWLETQPADRGPAYQLLLVHAGLVEQAARELLITLDAMPGYAWENMPSRYQRSVSPAIETLRAALGGTE